MATRNLCGFGDLSDQLGYVWQARLREVLGLRTKDEADKKFGRSLSLWSARARATILYQTIGATTSHLLLAHTQKMGPFFISTRVEAIMHQKIEVKQGMDMMVLLPSIPLVNEVCISLCDPPCCQRDVFMETEIVRIWGWI